MLRSRAVEILVRFGRGINESEPKELCTTIAHISPLMPWTLKMGEESSSNLWWSRGRWSEEGGPVDEWNTLGWADAERWWKHRLVLFRAFLGWQQFSSLQHLQVSGRLRMAPVGSQPLGNFGAISVYYIHRWRRQKINHAQGVSLIKESEDGAGWLGRGHSEVRGLHVTRSEGDELR